MQYPSNIYVYITKSPNLNDYLQLNIIDSKTILQVINTDFYFKNTVTNGVVTFTSLEYISADIGDSGELQSTSQSVFRRLRSCPQLMMYYHLTQFNNSTVDSVVICVLFKYPSRFRFNLFCIHRKQHSYFHLSIECIVLDVVGPITKLAVQTN